MLTIWFHPIDDECSDQVEELRWMCDSAYLQWDAVADELVDLQKQLDDKVQALMVKPAECNRLAQHASNVTKGNAVPHLADDTTAKKMAKLNREITAKNALSKTIHVTLAAALQAV